MPNHVARFVTDRSLEISVAALLVIVAGTVVEQGLFQKTLFLVSTPTLAVTAYVSGERMLTILQVVLTISAVLAFFPAFDVWTKFAVIVPPALAGVGYLARIDYATEDPYWPIGAVGLLGLAAGYSVAGELPFAFNVFMAVGSWTVAAYATIGYLTSDNRIQLVWITLNIGVAATPTLRVVGSLL